MITKTVLLTALQEVFIKPVLLTSYRSPVNTRLGHDPFSDGGDGFGRPRVGHPQFNEMHE